MIRVHYAGHMHTVPVTVFRGGEVNVVLPFDLRQALKDHNSAKNEAVVIANITNSNELIAQALVADALRRIVEGIRLTLIIPYFPYGRQDRVCNPGEAFSLEVVCRFLKTAGWETIVTYEQHSLVAHKFLPNLVSRTTPAIKTALAAIRYHENPRTGQVILIAPDKGAAGRVSMVAATEGLEYVVCDKVRTKTDDGKDDIKITFRNDANGQEVCLAGKICVVIDDICDGGRTFLALSDELDKACAFSTHLFVTHGIFSYGNEILCDSFHTVHTTDSYDGGQMLPLENRAMPIVARPDFFIHPMDYSEYFNN